MDDLSAFQAQRQISNVNWNQVFYFSLVATHGSLKKASDILGLRSSTLSEHISQLESMLETTLFLRKGPKLILTEAGEKLSWQAKQMFENGLNFIETASSRKLDSAQLRIGLVPGPHLPIAHDFISNYVREFSPLNSKISQWNFEELEAHIAKGSLDFGFADQASKRSDLSSKLLKQSQIRLYVSSKWKHRQLKNILLEIPLLICQSDASTDAFLQKALMDANIKPCGFIKAAYPGILLDLCRNGLGVGAFGTGTIEAYKKDYFHMLSNPSNAPEIRSEAYLIWADNGENTAAVRNAKNLFLKR